MINRRQFFSDMWRRRRTTPRSETDRDNRYLALETHVRMELYPYDFALTESEESYLMNRVRSLLEETSDEDLFSKVIVERLDRIVPEVIEPWREADEEVNRHKPFNKD